jgi:NAD(P)-dependent dehydrogenase (short-subunit alcohol dehydrogenase family)
MNTLTGKVAIVTRASKGIGAAVARGLAAQQFWVRGEKEEGRTSKGASERPEQETQAGLAGSGRWEVPKET